MGFSDQLKKARLSMGYTQQQVADLMDITKSTYCGYETGKRRPNVARIKQLAHILNTSGDILLETGYGPTESDLIEKDSDLIEESSAVDSEIKEALAIFSELPDDLQQVALAQLRALSGVSKKEDK